MTVSKICGNELVARDMTPVYYSLPKLNTLLGRTLVMRSANRIEKDMVRTLMFEKRQKPERASATHAIWQRHKLRRLALVLVAVFVLVLGWGFVGVSIHLEKPALQQLADARATWNAKSINSYRMSGSLYVPLIMSSSFSVTVKQGKVVEINSPTGGLTSEQLQYLPSIFPAGNSQYTVEQLLDFAASKFANQPEPPFLAFCEGNNGVARYQVKFNPALGYVESLSLTNCPQWNFGGGGMCGTLADCASGFNVTSFEPLPD